MNNLDFLVSIGSETGIKTTKNFFRLDYKGDSNDYAK